MPNDAKLGLVVGVGLVITVAVLFFRKDTPAGEPAGEPAPAGIVRPIPSGRRRDDPIRTALARPTAREVEAPAPTVAVRRHTVRDGDTLFSLSRLYYGDAGKFDVIYRANRGALQSPDALPVGAELVIPDGDAAAGGP